MKFDVDLLIKITGIAIIVAIIEQMLEKADKPEYALIVTIAGLIVIISAVIPEIADMLDLIRHTFGV